jgi:hypothetical protein
VVVLIQLVDSSSRFGVQYTLDVLELVSTAVATEGPLGEELDEVVVTMTRDAARITESCFLRWIGVAGQAGVDGLSNVSCAV